MRYTVLCNHTVIDCVEVSVYAKNPDEAVTLVLAMGFDGISQVTS